MYSARQCHSECLCPPLFAGLINGVDEVSSGGCRVEELRFRQYQELIPSLSFAFELRLREKRNGVLSHSYGAR